MKPGKPIVWGMLHVPALPGSPYNRMSLEQIYQWVKKDAETLLEANITHMVLENLGDRPYFKQQVPVHTVAFMTKIGTELIANHPEIQLGINVLRNDAVAALAIAASLRPNAHFIRVNVLVGAVITDQGIIEGIAAKLLRIRKEISAEDIEIWADIKVKHSTMLAPKPIIEMATELVERAGATKIVLTGPATGKEIFFDDLKTLSTYFSADKLVIGSGIKPSNISQYIGLANNFIVGSSMKHETNIFNHIDLQKAFALLHTLT